MPTPEVTDYNRLTDILVRDASETDFDAITEIYRHHVLNGTASFEEIPPDRATLLGRHAAIRENGLPYLVAEDQSTVIGYCYASLYRPRSAYRHTIEDSIYIAPTHTGRGIGDQLLTDLIKQCEAGPWRQMIAAIGDSANRPSIRLHEKHGFTHNGILHDVGYKFDRWLDSVLMQRPLDGQQSPLPGPNAKP
ncbi:N-acetyltransferase family protein [Thalassospira sp. MA62]|nr:N-acetyltransferase family protein [Thalassospira sp. MA62]